MSLSASPELVTNQTRVITLTTDFGAESPYVAIVKGVILSINPRVTIVDITHSIAPQDVRQAAVVLDDVARWFPAESIHVGVVDPGVGSERAIVYARCGRRHYVAPDNGLLSRVTRTAAPDRLVTIANPSFWLSPVSATFHGRDIFAPVAAHLSLGLDPGQLGPPQATLQALAWPEPRVENRQIVGQVQAVDSFGNVTSNIAAELVWTAVGTSGKGAPASLIVTCGRHVFHGLRRTYADAPTGTPIALIGSSGYLELAIAGSNAARSLQIERDDEITVQW